MKVMVQILSREFILYACIVLPPFYVIRYTRTVHVSTVFEFQYIIFSLSRWPKEWSTKVLAFSSGSQELLIQPYKVKVMVQILSHEFSLVPVGFLDTVTIKTIFLQLLLHKQVNSLLGNFFLPLSSRKPEKKALVNCLSRQTSVSSVSWHEKFILWG